MGDAKRSVQCHRREWSDVRRVRSDGAGLGHGKRILLGECDGM